LAFAASPIHIAFQPHRAYIPISVAHGQYEEMSISNSSLTHEIRVRPRIVFQYARHSKADKELWTDVFGGEPLIGWMEFNREHMTPGTREHRMMLRNLKQEDRDKLMALRLLRRAATSRVSADLIDAAKRLLTDYPKNFDVVTAFKSPAQIMQLYAHLLSESIRSASLIVESEGTDATIVIRCPNMRVAAFVYASFGGLEICGGCGKLFAPNPERMSQLYCCKNCGQRIYQREFRKRQKKSRSKPKRRK
jgi:hypothetical protein